MTDHKLIERFVRKQWNDRLKTARAHKLKLGKRSEREKLIKEQTDMLLKEWAKLTPEEQERERAFIVNELEDKNENSY